MSGRAGGVALVFGHLVAGGVDAVEVDALGGAIGVVEGGGEGKKGDRGHEEGVEEQHMVGRKGKGWDGNGKER